MIVDLTVAAHKILGNELDALILGNIITPSESATFNS